MDIIEAFLGFLLAFIVKDFYDIFLRNPVLSALSKYKILITPKKGGKK